MAKDFASMEDSNRSDNPSIHDVSDPARRTVLRGGAAASLMAMLGGCASVGDLLSTGPSMGFKPIPPGFGDQLVVPEGYTAQVIAAWGEPVGIPGQMPDFRMDASNSAQDQAVQMGMHHDGLVFFPLGDGRSRGLLAMNHEYTDDGLLHVGGMRDRKSVV